MQLYIFYMKISNHSISLFAEVVRFYIELAFSMSSLEEISKTFAPAKLRIK